MVISIKERKKTNLVQTVPLRNGVTVKIFFKKNSSQIVACTSLTDRFSMNLALLPVWFFLKHLLVRAKLDSLKKCFQELSCLIILTERVHRLLQEVRWMSKHLKSLSCLISGLRCSAIHVLFFKFWGCCSKQEILIDKWLA